MEAFPGQPFVRRASLPRSTCSPRFASPVPPAGEVVCCVQRAHHPALDPITLGRCVFATRAGREGKGVSGGKDGVAKGDSPLRATPSNIDLGLRCSLPSASPSARRETAHSVASLLSSARACLPQIPILTARSMGMLRRFGTISQSSNGRCSSTRVRCQWRRGGPEPAAWRAPRVVDVCCISWPRARRHRLKCP
jgi:hypothetical protein